MSPLEKIIDDVKKKLGVDVDISPENMKLLKDVMSGKVSAAKAKKDMNKLMKEVKKEKNKEIN